MPYSDVSELPGAVKKLPEKKQRQFMHVWNGVYQKCTKEGGDKKECESSAFAQAWGVVKKEDEENFFIRAIKHFAEKLDYVGDIFDTGGDDSGDTDHQDVLEKSLVMLSPDNRYYAADGKNILDIGYTMPADVSYEGHDQVGKYALLIDRGDGKLECQLLGNDDLVGAQEKALQLAENNKNEVRSVRVACGIPNRFSGRPLFHSRVGYHYVSKEEADQIEIEKKQLSSASINDLPDSAFAYIEPGGKKDESGRTTPRSKRHFPVHDEAHARNALARAPQSPFGSRAMPRILAACKKFGIKVSEKKEAEILEVELRKADMERGLVYGIVYEPDTVDTHGDFTSADEIERAAHNFLPHAAMNLQHKEDVTDVEVVESYIAPSDFTFPSGENVKKGSWVLVTKVKNEELKQAILRGEITGLSLEGTAVKIGE